MGLRVLAIGKAPILCSYLTCHNHRYALDTGVDKKKMSMDLGANAFIDFTLTKDLVKDIKDITGGEGVNAAVITAANVGSNSCYLPILTYFPIQPAAYMQAIDYIRCGGTLVVVGMPAGGKLGADIFYTVYKVR